MEIRAAREAFMPALMKVGGVVERRQTLPIVGNLLISAGDSRVELSGTDLEIEVQSGFDANVEEGGEVTIPARKFMDICRALPEESEIVLTVVRERAMVVAGRSRFTLGTLPAKAFPIMEMSGVGVSVEIEQARLKYLLEKTAFAMAHQDVRYYLNGLFLEVKHDCIKAVATDGHRLAKVELDGSFDVVEDLAIIMPRKTVLELNRILGGSESKCLMDIGERVVRVQMGETTVTSKLVEGRYPDYERVIPRGGQKLATLERDALRQALIRTAILSNEKYKGVTLSFDSGRLRCLTHNPEQEEAEEDLEAEYTGEATAIGFNVGYLMDVLNVLDGGHVEIFFSDSSNSAVLRNMGREGETFVVMPMRL
jgi:DNA polymerase-3 subunit beta